MQLRLKCYLLCSSDSPQILKSSASVSQTLGLQLCVHLTQPIKRFLELILLLLILTSHSWNQAQRGHLSRNAQEGSRIKIKTTKIRNPSACSLHQFEDRQSTTFLISTRLEGDPQAICSQLFSLQKSAADVKGEISISVEKQDVMLFLQSHNETQSVFWEHASISLHHLSFQISLGNKDTFCFPARNASSHKEQDCNEVQSCSGPWTAIIPPPTQTSHL